MTTHGDPLDDLLAWSRRGALSEAEQRRLREALASEPETRLLYQAGRAFDDEAPVQAGDDALIERIARKVERAARPSPRIPRWAIVRAALAGAFAAGLAMATLQHFHVLAPTPPPASATPGSPPALAANAGARSAPSGEHEPPAQVAPSPSPAPAAVSAATPSALPGASPHEPTPAPGVAAPSLAAPGAAEVQAPTLAGSAARAEFPDAPASEPGSSASELFSAANRARVAGDLARASSLYLKLQELFPSSSEALASRVTLGMILLKQSDPKSALSAFRSYLAQGGGATRAEALWGEAQALRQLGQASEERDVLGQLLASYPRSAYAAPAQKRLLDLH